MHFLQCICAAGSRDPFFTNCYMDVFYETPFMKGYVFKLLIDQSQVSQKYYILCNAFAQSLTITFREFSIINSF